MKTSELTGSSLDWAVAKCEGVKTLIRCGAGPSVYLAYVPNRTAYKIWAPAKNWKQAGPIIDRERIGTRPNGNGWVALHVNPHVRPTTGPTPLIAAMRCYVASKLGDTVEIPEELEQ